MSQNTELFLCEKTGELFPDVSEILEKKDDVCPVDWALNIAEAGSKASCGKCVMCREGLLQIYTIISDITMDQGESEDLELITDVCQVIQDIAGCEMAKKASELVLASVHNYSDEWGKHIRMKRCSTLVCKKFINFVILPDKCQGCLVCKEKCPDNAILGDNGLIHVVEHSKCTKCGLCLEICPHEAVVKAGAVLPKIPEAPVPVGSFEAAAPARRRRRG